MKHAIKICLFILILTTFNLCKGGTVSIKDVYTYSNYYSDDSSDVYLVFYGMFSSDPCILNSYEVNDTVENEIVFKACYRIGVLTTLCYRVDTFYLGVYKNGYMDVKTQFTATGSLACSSITPNNTVDKTLSTFITNIEKVVSSTSNVLFFPNPTNSTLTIQNDVAWQEATATLTNPEGRVVMTQALNNSKQQTIDIGHLPAGLYFVTVQSAQQKWVKRVVKAE